MTIPSNNVGSHHIYVSINSSDLISKFFSRKISNYINKHKLNITIEGVDYLSDISLALSLKYNINSVPFGVHKDKILLYKEDLTEKEIGDFLF